MDATLAKCHVCGHDARQAWEATLDLLREIAKLQRQRDELMRSFERERQRLAAAGRELMNGEISCG